MIEYRFKARRKSTAEGWTRFPIVTYDSVKKCFKSATWVKGTFGTHSEIRLKINDIVVDTTDEKEALSRDAKTEKLNEMMQKQIKQGSKLLLKKMRKKNLKIKRPSTTSSKGGVFGGSTTSSNGGLFGGSSTQRTNASTGGLFSRPTTTSSKGL